MFEFKKIVHFANEKTNKQTNKHPNKQTNKHPLETPKSQFNPEVDSERCSFRSLALIQTWQWRILESIVLVVDVIKSI